MLCILQLAATCFTTEEQANAFAWWKSSTTFPQLCATEARKSSHNPLKKIVEILHIMLNLEATLQNL